MLLDAESDLGLPLLQLARFFVVLVPRNPPAMLPAGAKAVTSSRFFPPA
jgi:hypothetical protein